MPRNRWQYRVLKLGERLVVCLMSSAIISGCSVQSSREMGETSTSDEIPKGLWEEGEDCRNWGASRTPLRSRHFRRRVMRTRAIQMGSAGVDFASTGFVVATRARKRVEPVRPRKKAVVIMGFVDPLPQIPIPITNARPIAAVRVHVRRYLAMEARARLVPPALLDSARTAFVAITPAQERAKLAVVRKRAKGVNGVCGPIASTKNTDNECSCGYCSGLGTCVLYNGVACAAADECMFGYCVDGVCCGNPCDGTCYSCSAAKKGGGVHGQCGPILLGNDPDNECALTCAPCSGTLGLPYAPLHLAPLGPAI
jgi:hypothetical protein